MTKIEQAKCPDLYAKAVEYASTFQIWIDTRIKVGGSTPIHREWLDYSKLAGEPKLPTTAAFWESHLLFGPSFPKTVAHEAAHGIGFTDGPEATPFDPDPAALEARSCMR